MSYLNQVGFSLYTKASHTTKEHYDDEATPQAISIASLTWSSKNPSNKTLTWLGLSGLRNLGYNPPFNPIYTACKSCTEQI